MEEQDSDLALRTVTLNDHEERPLDSSEQKELVQVQLLTSHAILPIRTTIGLAGYDLISPEAISIPAYSRKLIDTQLAFAIPHGYYGCIAARSGLSIKSIDIGAGVINSDYCGSVKALLINNGNVPFQVAKGDRIAQMIIEKILTQGLVPVTELPKTERSKKGFGSTGSRNMTLQSINIDEGNGAIVEMYTTLQDEGNDTLLTR